MAEISTVEIKCAYDKIVEIKELKPHPKNPNKHSKEQIERLAKIIAYQGIRRPIRVSKLSGYITAGHGLVLALRSRNETTAPANYQDYENEDQEYADIIADNSIASWADLYLASINLEVPSLGPNFDIDLLGLKDFEIEPADKYGDKDADEVPIQRATDIRLGDLFELGNHRLLCGDSTQSDSVSRLMNGEKADMVFTDPPYNIAYEGGSKKRTAIENDEMGSDDFYSFLKKCYELIFTYTKNGASIYVCHADTERVNFTRAFTDSGFHLSSIIIWVKNNSTFGRQDYFWKHEPIIYGWNSNGAHSWHGPNNEDTVWCIDRPSRSEDHPTMKPITLVERALKNSSTSGALIYEPFSGSGTTLIACEKTNRKCFAMELDPQYVQVCIDRWEDLTLQKAVKLDS